MLLTCVAKPRGGGCYTRIRAERDENLSIRVSRPGQIPDFLRIRVSRPGQTTDRSGQIVCESHKACFVRIRVSRPGHIPDFLRMRVSRLGQIPDFLRIRVSRPPDRGPRADPKPFTIYPWKMVHLFLGNHSFIPGK